MPNVAEMKQIFKATPIDQAIMMVGIHGIGKSEIVKAVFEKEGYVVVTLFLGQMADAGDMIGLPDRTEVEMKFNGEIVMQKITEFCPPKWWPVDDEAKIVIFMDEFNRGKPEIYQCVFDMVLNRKLNGFPLPPHTRIVSAMNPAGDEDGYDVTELDAALEDRFNIYNFHPDTPEWIDWAVEEKLNKYVIGFISKNGSQYLDPPNSKNRKLGEQYPSRRSWKRVSDIINGAEELISTQEMTLLKTMMLGIVGAGATSKFANYVKDTRKGISAGKIVTGWDKEVERKLKGLNKQEYVHLNQEIATYISTEHKVLFDASKASGTYAYNVEKYLQMVPKEIAAEFMDHVTQAHQKGLEWPDKLLSLNPTLVNWFVDVLHGKSDEDKEVDKMNNDNEDRPWENDDNDDDKPWLKK